MMWTKRDFQTCKKNGKKIWNKLIEKTTQKELFIFVVSWKTDWVCNLL